MGYFGSKATSGLCQALIALMPPHSVYIESHLGGGALMKRKPTGVRSIGIDRDAQALEAFACDYPVELVHGCAHAFLASFPFLGPELVYSDPPYLHATRRSARRYRFDYEEVDHVALLDLLKDLPCQVMVSSHPSALYDEMYNSREASLSFAVLHGVNYGQEVVDRYAELSSTDPVSQAALRYPGKALRCSQLAGRDAIHDTQMYKEVLRPLGIEFRMVAIIGDQETQFCVLGLMRGREETEFDDDDMALLGDISPHFRRAMELYARLSAQQAGGKFALAALDTLSIGIAILDANSSVLFLNQAGNAIIDDQGGLVVRNGHLTAERAGEGNKLRQIVQQLTTGSEAASKFMTFVRSDGREPLPATISSFDRPPGLPVPLAQAYGLVIVIFTDPGRQLEVSWELLQRLYGLTPAESRLLAELVGGRSLVETADLLGITKETGRKRLSDVFQKGIIKTT